MAFLKKNDYFWLFWVFFAEHGLSLVAETGSLFVAACGLLVVVAHPIAEHTL